MGSKRCRGDRSEWWKMILRGFAFRRRVFLERLFHLAELLENLEVLQKKSLVWM